MREVVADPLLRDVERPRLGTEEPLRPALGGAGLGGLVRSLAHE
jgi:hypothetical protein